MTWIPDMDWPEGHPVAVGTDSTKPDQIKLQVGPVTLTVSRREARDLHELLGIELRDPPKPQKPVTCGKPLGSRPEWMSPDQYDQCHCVLPPEHVEQREPHRCHDPAHGTEAV